MEVKIINVIRVKTAIFYIIIAPVMIHALQITTQKMIQIHVSNVIKNAFFVLGLVIKIAQNVINNIIYFIIQQPVNKIV